MDQWCEHTATCTDMLQGSIFTLFFNLKEWRKKIHSNLSSTSPTCHIYNWVLHLWQPPPQKHSTHPALTLCQDWIKRLKLVYISRWLFFWKACNPSCICLRSRLNLLSKQRSNYSNQICLISLKLKVSIKAEEELKKKQPHLFGWNKLL